MYMRRSNAYQSTKRRVSYSADKGTDLETIVQELADFCDDRDETRFGEDYYILDMK